MPSAPSPDYDLRDVSTYLFGARLTGDRFVDEHDVLRRVVAKTVHRYCESNSYGYANLHKALTGRGCIPAKIRRELQRIAEEEVIPALSPDERANMERTRRSREGPLHTERPPSYPTAGRLPRWLEA